MVASPRNHFQIVMALFTLLGGAACYSFCCISAEDCLFLLLSDSLKVFTLFLHHFRPSEHVNLGSPLFD
jgi:hypothetical protein